MWILNATTSILIKRSTGSFEVEEKGYVSNEAKLLCCFEAGRREQEPRNERNVALESGKARKWILS